MSNDAFLCATLIIRLPYIVETLAAKGMGNASLRAEAVVACWREAIPSRQRM